MELIVAYKKHDKENGTPLIGYQNLRELNNAIKMIDNQPDVRYIKPENGIFICKIFKKVQKYLKKDVYTLNNQEIQVKQPAKHYIHFIDLTDKINDYKNKLLEKACLSKEKQLRKKAIRPSGKKSTNQHQRVVVPLNVGKNIPQKPSFENKVTKKHRTFYVTIFSHQLQNNKHLGVMNKQRVKTIARHLESKLNKKHFTAPISYEKYGDRTASLLQQLCSYKHLSLAWRQEKFSFNYLVKLRGNSGAKLAQLEKRASQSRNVRKENAKKNEAMLGKRIRSSSLEQKGDIYLDSCSL